MAGWNKKLTAHTPKPLSKIFLPWAKHRVTPGAQIIRNGSDHRPAPGTRHHGPATGTRNPLYGISDGIPHGISHDYPMASEMGCPMGYPMQMDSVKPILARRSRSRDPTQQIHMDLSRLLRTHVHGTKRAPAVPRNGPSKSFQHCRPTCD